MDKIRLGIVGLGNMGSGHFYNVFGGKCPSVEIAAVCDLVPEKMEKAKEHPEVACFTDYIECLTADLLTQY